MSIDFPFWLLTATFATGFIVFVDKIYCYFTYTKNNFQLPEGMPRLVDYAKSFFPVLLFVLILRSFIFEPFRVPTGSLEPTVNKGDFIISNKFVYGLRLPIWGHKLYSMNLPKNGDIAIFRVPVDKKTWMVKRVIGIPGDKIDYVNKKLIVNGIAANYQFLGTEKDTDDGVNYRAVKSYEEELFGKKHKIYNTDSRMSQDFHIVVPPDHYFMMGDNRDNSDDSRYWGFVPEPNLEGKAIVVWLSWDQFDWTNIRWHRFGTWLNA